MRLRGGGRLLFAASCSVDLWRPHIKWLGKFIQQHGYVLLLVRMDGTLSCFLRHLARWGVLYYKVMYKVYWVYKGRMCKFMRGDPDEGGADSSGLLKVFHDMDPAHMHGVSLADPAIKTYSCSHKHLSLILCKGLMQCLQNACDSQLVEFLSNHGNPARMSPLVWAFLTTPLYLGLENQCLLYQCADIDPSNAIAMPPHPQQQMIRNLPLREQEKLLHFLTVAPLLLSITAESKAVIIFSISDRSLHWALTAMTSY